MDELQALTEAATELVSNQTGYAIKCQQKDDGTVEVVEWGEGITPPSDSDLAAKKAEQEKNVKAVAKGLGVFVKPLVLMLLWNWLMPGLFGLQTIGYLKAFAMCIITHILFKNDESES